MAEALPDSTQRRTADFYGASGRRDRIRRSPCGNLTWNSRGLHPAPRTRTPRQAAATHRPAPEHRADLGCSGGGRGSAIEHAASQHRAEKKLSTDGYHPRPRLQLRPHGESTAFVETPTRPARPCAASSILRDRVLPGGGTRHRRGEGGVLRRAVQDNSLGDDVTPLSSSRWGR